MKNNLVICLLLCLSFPAIAQKTTHNNTISFVAGIERPIYWDLNSTYLGIDYEYQLNPSFKLAAGAGTSFRHNRYTSSEINSHEKLIGVSPYLRLFFSPLPNKEKFDFNIGLGCRQFRYKAEDTKELNGGMAISKTTKGLKMMAFAFILQETFYLNERVSFGLTGEYNVFLKRGLIPALTIFKTDPEDFHTASTELATTAQSPLQFTLKAGYRF